MAAAGILLWGGCRWATSALRSALTQRLAERGLKLKYQHESWSPWSGLTLTDAALCRLSADHEPLLEISTLHMDMLWREMWRERTAATRWQTRDATLILHDNQGAVRLEHLTTDFSLEDGKIDVPRLDTPHGPLSFALTGKVSTDTGDAKPDGAFQLDLQALRAVLDALGLKADSGAFAVTGNFDLDLRNTPVKWNATLHGKGQQVEWRGLPMRETVIEAQVSQAGMKLSGDLKLTKGSAHMDLTREDWAQSPLIMSGTLTDSAGRADEFHGRHLGDTDTLTIAQLSGSADLLEFARNYPALAREIPATVTVKTFPDIVVKNLVWQAGAHPPEWSLSGLQLRTPAAVVVTVRNHPLAIDHITGQLSYERRSWRFEGMKGQILGGRFALDGGYDGKTLNNAEISLQALHLAHLSPWLGKISSKLDKSDLSLTYKGTICSHPTNSNGGGSVVLTHAPVVHIPLLDEAYALFPKLLPHKQDDGTGEFQLAFTMTKGMAHIDPFKARSESLTVTASGTVDLVKRQVSGRARANPRGVVGVATAPLSHVLLEMQVSGPLEDVHVSPLGPVAAAKTLITGATKAPASAAHGSVKLSSDVLREGLSLPFEALGMFGKE